MAQTINQSIPHRRVIAINATGGAQVVISATMFAGYVEIQECPPSGAGAYAGGAFVAQGLEYQTPDDGLVGTIALVSGNIWSLGTKEGPNRSVGQPGWKTPDGSAVPATVYMKVVSATAVATFVEVREWPQR